MVIVGTVDWWHVYDADSDSPAFHDHASHRPVVKADRPASERSPDHCYLCHWLRAFKDVLSASIAQPTPRASGRHTSPAVAAQARDVIASLIAARAPPL
jgi:hypothetical protein